MHISDIHHDGQDDSQSVILKENLDQDTRLDGGRKRIGNDGSTIELADTNLIQSKSKALIVTLKGLTFLSLIANDNKSLLGAVQIGDYHTSNGIIGKENNVSFILEVSDQSKSMK